MPVYTYKCRACDTVEYVHRDLKDIDTPPDTECLCEEPEWERVMSRTGVVRGETWGKKGALK